MTETEPFTDCGVKPEKIRYTYIDRLECNNTGAMKVLEWCMVDWISNLQTVLRDLHYVSK